MWSDPINRFVGIRPGVMLLTVFKTHCSHRLGPLPDPIKHAKDPRMRQEPVVPHVVGVNRLISSGPFGVRDVIVKLKN